MNPTSSTVVLQSPLFLNRRDAGHRLAEALGEHPFRNTLVLALPRGGVPVAFEIARWYGWDMDVLCVRKIGAPGNPELGLGAVVDGDPPQPVLNESLIRQYQIPSSYLLDEISRQTREIERRRRLYGLAHALPRVAGRMVIVADDGLATGATMIAALSALLKANTANILCAVPVGSPAALERLKAMEAEVVCLHAPVDFRAVGCFYQDFHQISDAEVLELLAVARKRNPTPSE